MVEYEAFLQHQDSTSVMMYTANAAVKHLNPIRPKNSYNQPSAHGATSASKPQNGWLLDTNALHHDLSSRELLAQGQSRGGIYELNAAEPVINKVLTSWNTTLE
ncbi:hypothetical protein COLO4_26581 [Corchorus olitorius]|uniref:Uncharacterized protein n=1 Tax=Corchorus olitorius TaxID=93759 RepID=A0A1R3HW69_9ROSI|nr:hypothetical protein COLO4_26581 [Corchorus olitorius]